MDTVIYYFKIPPTATETSSETTTWAEWETTSDEYYDENGEYDDSDETADDTNDRFDILDPIDYEVIGEECETYMGQKLCVPVYR